MIEWKKENNELVLYKDGICLGEIQEPTILVDKSTNYLLQIGDRKNVEDYYRIAKGISKGKTFTIHDNWCIVHLPKDIELIEAIMKTQYNQ